MKTIWIYLKVIAAVIVLSVILYFVGGKELRYSEVVKELQLSLIHISEPTRP